MGHVKNIVVSLISGHHWCKKNFPLIHLRAESSTRQKKTRNLWNTLLRFTDF